MRYLLFLLLGFSLCVNAQVFKGAVYIRDNSSLYLNSVYVTNLNLQKTVLADFNGKFSIQAKSGDVIRFTSIVSERKDMTVSETQLNTPYNIIDLPVAYTEIPEIVLNRFKATGNLKKDVLALNDTRKAIKLKERIGLPEPKGDGTSQEIPPVSFANGGLSISLESIYDIISGNYKKKQRTLEYEKMMLSIKEIRQYFGDSYFEKLNIPQNLIDNYLMFVYTSDNLQLVLGNNKFEVIAHSMERFLPIYLKRVKNSHLMDIL